MTLEPDIAFVLMMSITTLNPPLHKGDAPMLQTATHASESFPTLVECEKKAAILRARFNTAVGDQKMSSFSLTCVDKRGSKETTILPEKDRAKLEKDIKEMKGEK